MSRVIRPVSPASQRRQLMQRLALALTALENQSLNRHERRDLMAFVALVLQELANSVEETCAAWEKRSYYLKADRFRREWRWVDLALKRVQETLRDGQDNLPTEAREILKAAMEEISVPARLQKQRPWQGAWEAWQRQQEGGK
jgi:hypothetical protein